MAEHDGCKGCAYVSHGEHEAPCIKCAQNASDNYKRMTNADRIRAMSDDELAEFLRKTAEEEGTNIFRCEDLEGKPVCVAHPCNECGGYLEWLQSEVEE